MKKIKEFPDRNLQPVFIYGTLMDPRTRDMVLKKKVDATSVNLNDYKRDTHSTPEGKDFHSIAQDVGKKVKGDVILVNQEELDKLISWESQYHIINVRLSNGQNAKAFKLKIKDEK